MGESGKGNRAERMPEKRNWDDEDGGSEREEGVDQEVSKSSHRGPARNGGAPFSTPPVVLK